MADIKQYLRDQWPGSGQAREQITGIVDGSLRLVPVTLLPRCHCGELLEPADGPVTCLCGARWLVGVGAVVADEPPSPDPVT